MQTVLKAAAVLLAGAGLVGLAGCDSTGVQVDATVVDPPVDPGAPVAFSELVSDTIATDTNDTAEPIDVNNANFVIDADADFTAVLTGGSGV